LGFCRVSFLKNRGDLVEKIKMLDKNLNLINDLKKKAFTRVTKFYTWEKVIADYDKFFKMLNHE
jgi:glycosyltransferase involved in cell wall biosynthesis